MLQCLNPYGFGLTHFKEGIEILKNVHTHARADSITTTGGVTVVPKEFEKLISYNAGLLFWDPMTGIGNLHALNILR